MARNKIVEDDLQKICRSDLPWEHLQGKTVLVSGANGLLPAYMVETLLYLKKGVRVIAVVRDAEKAALRFKDHLDDENLAMIVQDVCDPIQVDGPVHYIAHAASQASPKYYRRDPIGTMLPNMMGTRNLLELAKEKRVDKFLFFSTSEVYGEAGRNAPAISENDFGSVDPLHYRSCYSESKRAGEALCAAYFHQHDVPAVIVRPFHTYGPMLASDDGRVFADFVFDVLSGRDITVNGNGAAVRAFCYISDATAGFFTALLKGRPGEAYNVANPGAEVSILQLAEKLARLVPGKKTKVCTQEPDIRDHVEGGGDRWSPNIEKMNGLGWFPSVSIEEGFKRTLLSYEDQGVP